MQLPPSLLEELRLDGPRCSLHQTRLRADRAFNGEDRALAEKHGVVLQAPGLVTTNAPARGGPRRSPRWRRSEARRRSLLAFALRLGVVGSSVRPPKRPDDLGAVELAASLSPQRSTACWHPDCHKPDTRRMRRGPKTGGGAVLRGGRQLGDSYPIGHVHAPRGRLVECLLGSFTLRPGPKAAGRLLYPLTVGRAFRNTRRAAREASCRGTPRAWRKQRQLSRKRCRDAADASRPPPPGEPGHDPTRYGVGAGAAAYFFLDAAPEVVATSCVAAVVVVLIYGGKVQKYVRGRKPKAAKKAAASPKPTRVQPPARRRPSP